MNLRNKNLFDLVGEDGLVALSARWGGTPLDVPARQRGKTWHRLVEALGEEGAARLVERYPGDRIEAPRLCKRTIMQRNARIQQQRSDVRTVRELAREHHLTTRWVRKITNEMEEGEQLSLF